MNKYQEAVDYLFVKYANSTEEGSFLHRHHIDVIRELVDKATPIKPKSFNDLRECCLCSCGYDFYDWGYNEYKYCPNCGKKVDWSEDE